MRKRDRDRYKKLLTAKRAELLDKTSRTTGEGREQVVEGGEDYVDDAVTQYTREFLLSLSDLERRQLQLVEEALQRIDDGSYGECLSCGEAIGAKRLAAIPWAATCVQCQERAEREEMSQQTLFRDDVADDEEE